VYDCSFKTMIDSFIQNSLNMMILYMSCRSKSVRVSTSVSPSNLVNKGKNNLLSNDLLWRIDDHLLMLNIHYTEFHALELVDCLLMLSIHIYTMIRVSITMSMESMPMIFMYSKSHNTCLPNQSTLLSRGCRINID
jgi:hypothetical protein